MRCALLLLKQSVLLVVFHDESPAEDPDAFVGDKSIMNRSDSWMPGLIGPKPEKE
jgi:hypothetical protein